MIEMECLGITLVMPAVCTVCFTGSQTVEQIKKNLWTFMRLVNFILILVSVKWVITSVDMVIQLLRNIFHHL